MNKTTLITLLGASFLAGCSDGAMLGSAPTTPKRAAELCNGWDQNVTPNPEEAKIVGAYRAGEITFNECMGRLRS